MIVYPKLKMILTLNTVDAVSSNKELMIRDNLSKYINTNYAGYFILAIENVLEIGDTVAMQGTSPITYNIECIIEFKTRKLVQDDQFSMVHGFTVKSVLKIASSSSNECYSISATNEDEFMSATVNVMESGIVDIGMTIPIRVLSSQYPQNNINSISINGVLIEPLFHDAMECKVLAKDDNEKCGVLYDEFIDYVNSVKKLPRTQFFVDLLYPYKKQKKGKYIVLYDALADFKECTVAICDHHKSSDLEFSILKKESLIEISFTTFVKEILAMGRKYWKNVERLAEIYESDDMFNSHKTLWKYFESKKK